MEYSNLSQDTIIIAGATGDLGGRIASFLLTKRVKVKALVRQESDPERIAHLKALGAEISVVDFDDVEDLTSACEGGSSLISALSGLNEVIIECQTNLLNAAVAAGVPRFIPSDFSIDFTRLPYGTNRNLDLRKQFKERLDQAPIAATSIFNGMFTDLLTGEAPLVLFPINRILFWGNAHQQMDFTTIADTAKFTALAALDPHTPRQLCVAGDVLSATGLQEAASQATGQKFGLLRVGGIGVLDFMIKMTRFFVPGKDQIFPPWQGMQYLRNMLQGAVKLESLDNDRYPGMQWTKVQEVLAKR